MRALLTGGAGFIGSHLADVLVERGDELLVIDDLSSGRRENLAGALDAGAELLEADIRDGEAIAAAFAEHRPETVFHLAAQIDVRRSVAEPAFDLDVNVGATIGLLEQSRIAGVGRFALASTGGAIYGEGEGLELPLGEDAACRPDAPYGQSKLAAEGYLGLYGRLHGLSTVALRLGNVYGPRQDPHGEAGVVAIFCGAMLGGGRPRVFGDGRQTRDYVYVGDVVDAFLAAEAATGAGPYNVGTGIETDVNTLGERLAAACGIAWDPEPCPPRAGEVQRISISNDLAAEELGWSPTIPLERGLERTLESFRG